MNNRIDTNDNADNNFVNLRLEQIVTYGEVMNPVTKKSEPEFYGRYLYNDRKDNMIFGLCAYKNQEFKYKINDGIDIIYIDAKIKYKLRARISDLWHALPDEEFAVNDMLNELKGNLNVDKYMLVVNPLGKPQIHTQREFFRLPLQMEIYYKEVPGNNINALDESELRFEITKARSFRREAEQGVLEEEAGYSKLITADISGGGFMYKSHYFVESDTYLECMMMVDREALPAIAKIIKSSDDDILGGYIVRVQFEKISEPVRDRLVRFLISSQRKQQRKFAGVRR